MPAPVITAISPADTWVKVATNVKAGRITKADTIKQYVHTYVDTGAAAPVGLTLARPFIGKCAKIESSYPIDVYVLCKGDTGSVMVEL